MVRNDNSSGNPDADFLYGSAGDQPVVGDWNSDTSSTVGVFRPEGSLFRWLLRNSNSAGSPDYSFVFGATGDLPVVGDWDGSGSTTIGVFRPEGSAFRWLLRDDNSAGGADYSFLYGATGDVPVTGDWDGNNSVTIGVVRQEGSSLRWLLRDSNSAGNADYSFLFGAAGDIPVTGDWDGSGTTTPGYFRPSTNEWYLRNSNAAGGADVAVFTYGTSSIGDKPVTGAWPVTNIEPVGTSISWTSTGFAGSLGTFMADVDGDGIADAIALNSNGILVSRSIGRAPLLASQSWSGAFAGSKGTFFADVTGDGKADAIAVNGTNVLVRVSNGTSFSSTSATWSSGAFGGSISNDFADVNGDGKADIIAVNTTGIVVGTSTGSSFNAGQSWSSAFAGSVGTFFKDVTGDRRADAIAVNAGSVSVRRAPASGIGFGTSETWSSTGFSGTTATLLGDVTGDGLADLVAVNANNIQMRRSGRWFFGENVETLSSTPPTASVTRLLADVTGDKRADYVELSASSPVRVRVRQDRKIPVRFVQLVSSCSSANSDQIVQDAVNEANKRYRDAGVWFFPQSIGSNPECGGFGLSRVVVAPVLYHIGSHISAGQTEVGKVRDAFNPSCDMGFSDLAGLDPADQLSWLSSRCAPPGEVLVLVSETDGSSFSGDPRSQKMILLTPGDGFSTATGRLAHEIGHYLGLPHTFEVDMSSWVDPLTGQSSARAAFWDLVYQRVAPPAPHNFFASRSQAFASEMQLSTIESNGGWFCPGGTICPTTSPPAGTIGIPSSSSLTEIFYTYLANVTPPTLDYRLKGLAPHPGDFATQPQFHVPRALPGLNFMSYGYSPGSPAPNQTGWLSLSQIEVIQNTLSVDIPTDKLDATGHVIFGDRPRLGTTAPAATLRYVPTGGIAGPGARTMASNGENTWVVGTNAFNSDGNQVYRWNQRTRIWEGKPAGAQQLALPSDGSDGPWAIMGQGGSQGRIKRWDGTTFVALANDSGPECARSLAVGVHATGTKAWTLGCGLPDSGGNFQIRRYDGNGWQTVAGPAPAANINGGVSVAVDWDGSLWVLARKAGTQTTAYRATLGSNGMPSSWAEFPAPAGTTINVITSGGQMHGADRLPVNIVNTGGGVSIFNRAGASWSPALSPPFPVRDVAGALPYLWVINANDGTLWYSR